MQLRRSMIALHLSLGHVTTKIWHPFRSNWSTVTTPHLGAWAAIFLANGFQGDFQGCYFRCNLEVSPWNLRAKIVWIVFRLGMEKWHKNLSRSFFSPTIGFSRVRCFPFGEIFWRVFVGSFLDFLGPKAPWKEGHCLKIATHAFRKGFDRTLEGSLWMVFTGLEIVFTSLFDFRPFVWLEVFPQAPRLVAC